MVPYLLVLQITLSLLLNFQLIFAKAFVPYNTNNNKHQEIIMSSSFADDEDTQAFHQCASSAVDLSNAHVSETGLLLSVQRSVRDWDNDCRQSYLYQFHLTQDSNLFAHHQPPTLIDNSISVRVPSPSGNKQVVVKKNKDTKIKSPILEVWQDGALVRRMSIKNHGAIINDPTGFGAPSWNPNESCIVYTAERLPPKTPNFWEKQDDETTLTFKGGKHVLGKGTAEEWGEQYVGQSPLLDIFILNVETGKVERVRNVPQAEEENTLLGGVALGQAVWHPSQPKITYTGWDAGGLGKMPRRLGMVFCRNRPSAVYSSNVSRLLERLSQEEDLAMDEETKQEDGVFTSQTSDFPYARSPQYLSNGELLFLANPNAFVSHEGCMALYRSTPDGKVDCIVPVVDKPDDTSGGPLLFGTGFPGLFLNQLRPNVGLKNNNKYLVLFSTWGSVTRLIRINMETKQIQLIKFPAQDGMSSQSILCQTPTGDLIVADASTNRPACLYLLPSEDLANDTREPVLEIPNAKRIAEFPSMAVSMYSPVQPKYVMPFDVQIISVPTDESLPPTQAIICLPKTPKDQKFPLVVIPHGGPHGCTTSNYAPGFAFLASHYAVVFPNYRGSTGFGQASLESLLTNVGTNDVQDVMAITRHVVKTFADKIDDNKIGICGGSHGGFLTAHCTSQFPDFFDAAVMRNPVTNIASMVTATDIPDWCHAEALGSYDFAQYRGPTIEEMQKMYSRSPITHVANVKTPTLVALGMKDLRVPPSQGLEWYHTLRSLNLDTELLLYPEDNHSLNRVATEADHWIHIKQWFDKYLKS